MTVGMAYVITGHDALTAYFTNMCHLVRPPSQNQHIATYLKFNMSILPHVESKSKHFSKMSKKKIEIVL